MINKPCYFVGIGAMKAGTSWLHNYLASRGDVFVPKSKELHYFNVKYLPKQNAERRLRLFAAVARTTTGYVIRENVGPEALESYLATHQNGRRENEPVIIDEQGQPHIDQDLMWEAMDRLMMEREPEAYRHFFERRLKPEHSAFGEITPAYSLLKENGFRAIKDLYPGAKILFLMRDPVRRHVSQLIFTKNFKMLDQLIDHPGFTRRGAYDKIWQELTAVFPREQIFVGFFETLFQDETVKRLCDFLGFPFQSGDYAAVVNPSNKKYEPTRDQVLKIRQVYKHVYDFCDQTFPGEVPDEWRKTE